ncbi:MAG: DUF2442 domain-containing protein [Deferrisomatales bacterium]
MRSHALGTDTSPAEVTNISRHGLWLLADGEELFLPFDDFPWFRDARVSALLHVEQPAADHFRWPELDIDLTRDAIRHPERYPLVAQGDRTAVHEPESD